MASLLVWLDWIKTNARVVLASSSEPRAAVLQKLCIPFEVAASNIAEDLDKRLLTPEAYALETANLKGLHVYEKYLGSTESGKSLIVISCDTVVLLDDRIMEKPLNVVDAALMLESLSGRAAYVLTGVTIRFRHPGFDMPDIVSFICKTGISFYTLTMDEIEAYLRSNEWINKAGAFGIQGLGALLISEIRGDLNNVIGLPLNSISEHIARNLENTKQSVVNH